MGDSAWGGAFNPRRMLETALSETDFESVSHEQMRSMIEAADPETTSKLGGKLKKAAVKIEEIGTELRTRMTAVAWEGEGGEAFREWGAKVANETLRLSEFSRTSGAWLTEAATVLADVKAAMPPPSSSSRALLDAFFERNPGGRLMLSEATVAQSKDSGGNSVLMGPTPKQALAAQTRLNEDHAEAVRLMTKLAGSYRWSSMNMSAAERPTFPPPPAAVMPPERGRGKEYVDGEQHGREGRSPSTPGAAREGGASSASSVLGAGGEAYTQASRAGLPIGPTHARPDEQVTLALAGGAASPPVPTPVTGPPGGNASPTGGDPARSGGIVPLTPLPGKDRPLGSPASGRGIPTSGRPMSGPSVADGRGAGRTAPRTPTDQGVHGGRPVPPNGGRPAGAIPRGTVIGDESARGYGRGPMVQGGPAGSAGPGRGQTPSGGRRLASEAGGIVGGRSQRPGTISGQDFTPGRAGLLRGSVPEGGEVPNGRAGMTPAAGARTSSSRDRDRGDRRGYSTEHEETSSQVARRAVPPVID